ncbi:hypothetical protein FB566_3873 [Stackebrandtia endophytica]|uniref:Tetratricopeptide repeat protein n=1 Tax=Stackebrandtia endophytica TaxID=1496996 RepID=A0A543B0K0_9ACTN|nr:hypothetical protein [Stackebrandtia endophytica]TQL78290.1 hypothetical protein FB566_3873 [Stackebrandtia endophytica]
MDTPTYLRLAHRARKATEESDWPTAATLWAELTRLNPTRGDAWYRLGEAHYQAGEPLSALTAYDAARRHGVYDKNAYLFRTKAELSLDIAKCLARLGDRGGAIEEVETALELGLPNRSDLDDEVFDGLRTLPRFVHCALPEAPADRDSGWRADLALLVTEIHRRSPVAHRFTEPVTRAAADLDRRIPELTDLQIVVELRRILALLGDGHAWVSLDNDRDEWRRELPIRLFQFGESVHITAAAPEHADLVGRELLSIDGHPVRSVLDAVESVTTHDNRQQLLSEAVGGLRHLPILHALGVADRPDRVRLEVGDGPGSRLVNLTAVDPPGPAWGHRHRLPGWDWLPDRGPNPPAHLARIGERYWFAHDAANSLIHFGFNSLVEEPDEPLAEFFEKLFAQFDEVTADRLVIDLRWNGGGNTFKALPLLTHILARPRLNRPNALFIVIGRNTFSAAQNTATMLGAHTEATFVGEPTGSSPNFTGEVIEFRLPYSGLTANVSDLYWQTSNPLDERTWIAPDLYTPPQLSDWVTGHDPALAAIHTYPVESWDA